MWALGDYAAVAADVIPDLGPVLVEASGVRPGERVLDVAAGTGNASIPAALAGAERRGQRPDARAARDRPRARRRGRRGRGVAPGRRRGAAVRRRVVRPRPVRASASCSPRTTRPAPTSCVRVCRPGGTDRPDQLDAGGLHRPDVRHHEAVRPAAPARCAAAAAVGQRGPRAVPARRPGDRRRGGQADRRDRAVRDARRSSATTSRPTTGRRSRSTRRSPTTPTGSRRWTRTSPTLGRRFDSGDGTTRLDWEYLLLTARKAA